MYHLLNFHSMDRSETSSRIIDSLNASMKRSETSSRLSAPYTVSFPHLAHRHLFSFSKLSFISCFRRSSPALALISDPREGLLSFFALRAAVYIYSQTQCLFPLFLLYLLAKSSTNCFVHVFFCLK